MQAQSKEREFLDVNTEESELGKILSEFSEGDMKLNMNPNEIPTKVKGIKPKPGFCVKAKDKNNAKIFINICHCSDLPEPPHITEAELMEILNSDEPSSYRVPMSLGEPHKENDKGGKDCICYDVIINSTYFETTKNNELFRRFLITLSYEGIQDKYGLNIDRESCIILKNKTYHGVMPDHHIRCKPLIAELGSAPYVHNANSTSMPPNIRTHQTHHCRKSKRVIPKFVLRKIPAEGYPSKLVLDAELPLSFSAKSMYLSMGEDRIVFHDKLFDYEVDIFLPYFVVQKKCMAEFAMTKKILTITMPVAPDPDLKTS